MDEKPVTIQLTYDEAAVLDEFLRRFSYTGKLAIEHQAEREVLEHLFNIIEKGRDNRLWPSLDAARSVLRRRFAEHDFESQR